MACLNSPVTVTRLGTSDTVRANLRDRLGSTVALGGTGSLYDVRSYDAFGKVREGDQSDREGMTLDLLPDTLRGFTGHEHVDHLRLIHMNGRMYDPNLGRFLSVDPLVQFPENSQSLNPYSYILNNPLSGRDPSGFAACTGSHIDRKDGSACAFQGVSGGGSNSPSMEQRANTMFQKSWSGFANRWSQRIDVQASKGSASSPSNGNAADIGATARKIGSARGWSVTDTVVVREDNVWVESRDATWNIYHAERNEWLDTASRSIGYDMIRGFYGFQLDLYLSQFSGDVPVVGLAGGAGLFRAVNAVKKGAQGARLAEHLRQLEKYGGGGVDSIAKCTAFEMRLEHLARRAIA